MPDISVEFQPSEENVKNGVIGWNLQLLERQYVPDTPPGDPTIEDTLASGSFSQGETRQLDDDTLITAINLTYNTRTGRFEKPNFQEDLSINNGDYSVLRTYLVVEGETTIFDESEKRWLTQTGKYRILTTYPHGWLTPHEADAAVSQEIDQLGDEGRLILPERIIPKRIREHGSSVNGHMEQRGTSRFIEKPADDTVIKSIDLFNAKHGPSLEEQLFKGAVVRQRA